MGYAGKDGDGIDRQIEAAVMQHFADQIIIYFLSLLYEFDVQILHSELSDLVALGQARV